VESWLVLAAFGVGLANFGTGLHVLPSQLAAEVSHSMPLIGWYGATGNLAFAEDDPNEVRAELQRISGTTWAVLPFDEVNAALETLARLDHPPHREDERPTPGLAFAVTAAHPGPVCTHSSRASPVRLRPSGRGPQARCAQERQTGPPATTRRLGCHINGHRPTSRGSMDRSKSSHARRLVATSERRSGALTPVSSVTAARTPGVRGHLRSRCCRPRSGTGLHVIRRHLLLSWVDGPTSAPS
jgi:hypothetical protein